MADGGRLALGENADNVFLNIVLKAKTADASKQIQAVAQGLLALVSLSQTENQDLMQLAQNTTVKSTENLVTLGLEYPVSNALEKLSLLAKHISQEAGQGKAFSGPKHKKHRSDVEKQDGEPKKKPASKAEPEAENE
jgi:hypothetical protein